MCKLYRIWLKRCWMLRKRQCMRDGEHIGGRQGLSPLSHFFLAPWDTTARREDEFVFYTVWIRSRGDGSRFSITSSSLIQTVLPGICDLRRRMKFRLSENGDLNYCFIYLFSIEFKPLNLRYPGWHATTTELWEIQVKL